VMLVGERTCRIKRMHNAGSRHSDVLCNQRLCFAGHIDLPIFHTAIGPHTFHGRIKGHKGARQRGNLAPPRAGISAQRQMIDLA